MGIYPSLGNTSPRFRVANLADLGKVDDRKQTTGTEAFVESEGDTFVLVKTSTRTVGADAVATRSGAGRWVRDGITALTAAVAGPQSWWIDPVTGSDSNEGTEARPLRTFAKLEAMLGDQRLSGHHFVYFPKGITEQINLTRQQIGIGAEVHFIGARTRVALVTVANAGYTAVNRATGQHAEVLVNGFDWAPHVGRMIRVVVAAPATGARAGVTAWVEADLGNGRAHISQPNQTVYGAPGVTSWSALTPSILSPGDQIEVVTLAEIARMPHIDLGQSTTPSGRITFEDFRFSEAGSITGGGIMSSSVRIIRCDVQYMETGGSGWTILHNSHVRGGSFSGGTDVRGGLLSGAISYDPSDIPSTVGYDVLMSTGARVIASAGSGHVYLKFGNVGVRASAASPFVLGQTAVGHLTGGQIYGTTAQGVHGFDMAAASRLIFTADAVPTLTPGGSLVNMRGGIFKNAADMAASYTNPINLSSLVLDAA